MEFLSALGYIVASTLNVLTAVTVMAVTVPATAVSYGNSFLDSGPPIEEPYVFVLGPRYFSHKFDVPFTQHTSCWYYAGDEQEGRHADTSIDIDENTWAFRCNKTFGNTQGLRGDETFDDLVRSQQGAGCYVPTLPYNGR